MMGLQYQYNEAQVSNTEADTALKIAQAAKEAGEASKKPIELKIEQTNKEIADIEKDLKAQNIEIGANEIVKTTAIAQKAMEELNQAMMETEIKKETKDAIIKRLRIRTKRYQNYTRMGRIRYQRSSRARRSTDRNKKTK